MRPRNVLLSTKQTALEYFKREFEDPKDVLSPEDLATIKGSHEIHYAALNHVRKVLDSAGISHQRVYQPYAACDEFKDRDLVISVGGDGTVLNTAHYVTDDTPVLTVKSDQRSLGALCTVDAFDFEKALERIVRDDFKIESWTRVEGRIGNKTDLALNEILVGPKYTPGTARYEVCFGNIREKQMSTMITASTGAGSTALYANIPGNEGVFSRTARELRFIVALYSASADYKLVKGAISLGQILEIRSLMNIGGIVSFDGDTHKRMHDFSRGKTIQIKVSDKPLKVIV